MSMSRPDEAMVNASAGAVAGAISRLAAAPFDLLKIRFQLQPYGTKQYASITQAAREIISTEGARALWKGTVSATMLWSVYGSVQFGVYSSLRGDIPREGGVVPRGPGVIPPGDSGAGGGGLGMLTGSIGHAGLVSDAAPPTATPPGSSAAARRARQWFRDGVAGAVSCATATIVSYPLDIARTQFSIQGVVREHQSLAAFFGYTLRHVGIAGLYKGLVPSLLGTVPYMGVNFAFYELFKGLAAVTSISTLPAASASDNTPIYISSTSRGSNNNSGSSSSDSTITASSSTASSSNHGSEVSPNTANATHSNTTNSTTTTTVTSAASTDSSATPTLAGSRTGDDITSRPNGDVDIDFSAPDFLPRTSLLSDIAQVASAGALSGGLSKLIMYPMDTIKRKFQSQVLINTFDRFSPYNLGMGKFGTDLERYVSIRQCARVIASREGIEGFYKGLTPAMCKAVASSAVTFTVYEVIKTWALRIVEPTV